MNMNLQTASNDAHAPQRLLISVDESKKRANAIRQSRASVALEGGRLPVECDEIDRRYIAGELTSDQHFAAYAALVRR